MFVRKIIKDIGIYLLMVNFIRVLRIYVVYVLNWIIDFVLEMRVLDSNDELIFLGKILVRFFIELRLGKMIIYGCIF